MIRARSLAGCVLGCAGVMVVDVEAVAGAALGVSALSVVGLGAGINSPDTQDIGAVGSDGILYSGKYHSLVNNAYCGMDRKKKKNVLVV